MLSIPRRKSPYWGLLFEHLSHIRYSISLLGSATHSHISRYLLYDTSIHSPKRSQRLHFLQRTSIRFMAILLVLICRFIIQADRDRALLRALITFPTLLCWTGAVCLDAVSHPSWFHGFLLLLKILWRFSEATAHAGRPMLPVVWIFFDHQTDQFSLHGFVIDHGECFLSAFCNPISLSILRKCFFLELPKSIRVA